MRIDIWSDVVCPWCYLGSRRLAAALDQVGRDGVEIHWRAFQLDPGAPHEPGDLRTALDRKYGARILRLDDPTPGGARPGGRHRLPLRPGAAGQHRRRAPADRVGRAPCGDPGTRWSSGSSTTTSPRGPTCRTRRRSSGAAAVGRARPGRSDRTARLRPPSTSRSGADQAEAHERGISGVPAFVIDDEWIIPGAQDTERMVQLLSRVGGSRLGASVGSAAWEAPRRITRRRSTLVRATPRARR